MSGYARGVTIELPWPPAGGQNARLHWRSRAHSARHYRQVGAIAALGRRPPTSWPKKLCLSLVFSPPDRRRYDLDNLIGKVKSGIDGVCDAIGIDDARFVMLCATLADPVRGGAVTLRIAPP